MQTLTYWLIETINMIVNQYGLFVKFYYPNVGGETIYITLTATLTFIIMFGLIIKFFRLIQE